MGSDFRVLDIWCHIDPRFGGVGPAASQLAMEVGRAAGWTIRLSAICGPQDARLADGIPPTVDQTTSASWRPAADLKIGRSLRSAIGECDVCHVHGLWLPHTLAARRVARNLRKPVVSSVHGMLEKWELANKGWKKRIYSRLLERSSLAGSACLRALSHREAEDYRRYGLRNPVAVVPNGIRPLRRTSPDLLFTRFPGLRHKPLVLYLSRVHYKKGILSLVRAWEAVARTHKDAHLLVAGPDCEGTLPRARNIAQQANLDASVTFAGTISGELKRSALSAARYFCLPSYSEGFSVAVLEALAIGLPVIVTPACNIDEVAACGAGLVASNEPDALAASIAKCLDLGESEWQTMSAQALKLARSRYDWGAIAQNMRAVYTWVLGGPKPACVTE